MDKQEVLGLLRSDVEAFNAYRRDNPKDAIDLSGADLQGSSLERAALGDAILQGANLRGANLVKANMAGANLRGADLREADLTDSTLHRADLSGADLRGAVVGGLTGAGRMCLHPSCFENVVMDQSHLEAALSVLNRNAHWEIRYEIVPRSAAGTD